MYSLTLSGVNTLKAYLRQLFFPLLAITALLAISPDVLAHGVPEGDKGFIQESTGVRHCCK